jgi:hypothetical protein
VGSTCVTSFTILVVRSFLLVLPLHGLISTAKEPDEEWSLQRVECPPEGVQYMSLLGNILCLQRSLDIDYPLDPFPPFQGLIEPLPSIYRVFGSLGSLTLAEFTNMQMPTGSQV